MLMKHTGPGTSIWWILSIVHDNGSIWAHGYRYTSDTWFQPLRPAFRGWRFPYERFWFCDSFGVQSEAQIYLPNFVMVLFHYWVDPWTDDDDDGPVRVPSRIARRWLETPKIWSTRTQSARGRNRLRPSARQSTRHANGRYLSDMRTCTYEFPSSRGHTVACRVYRRPI